MASIRAMITITTSRDDGGRLLLIQRQSLLNTPASIESFSNKDLAYTDLSRPLRNTERFAVEFNDPVSAGIVRLLFWRCPLAVTRLVIAVMIYTINRMAFAWAFTHIGKERAKVIPPSVAHLNAARTIPLITITRFVVAAFNNAAPNLMLWCPAGAVCSGALNKHFKLPASARLGVTGAKLMGNHKRLFSTIAAAAPFKTAWFDFDFLNGNQTAKPLASDIDRFHIRTPVSTASYDLVRGNLKRLANRLSGATLAAHRQLYLIGAAA